MLLSLGVFVCHAPGPPYPKGEERKTRHTLPLALTGDADTSRPRPTDLVSWDVMLIIILKELVYKSLGFSIIPCFPWCEW